MIYGRPLSASDHIFLTLARVQDALSERTRARCLTNDKTTMFFWCVRFWIGRWGHIRRNKTFEKHLRRVAKEGQIWTTKTLSYLRGFLYFAQYLGFLPCIFLALYKLQRTIEIFFWDIDTLRTYYKCIIFTYIVCGFVIFEQKNTLEPESFGKDALFMLSVHSRVFVRLQLSDARFSSLQQKHHYKHQ